MQNCIYLATDTGVYATVNSGTNWTRSARGSPTSSIQDILMDQTTRTLRVITHGRGAWDATVPLIGLQLSELSLQFADQALGSSSAALTETVTNKGTTNLAISKVAVGGMNASDFAKSADTCTGATVTPNNTCTVSLKFTPSAIGSRNALLTLTDSATGGPQTVSLNGTGTAAAAGVSPSRLTFGSQNIGTTSGTKPVTLSNTGNAALTIASIATNANFSQTNNCGTSVAAGGSCTISVAFQPTATGTLSGTLTITDNSHGALGSKQTAGLTGTGLVAIAVTLSPASKSLALSGTQVFTATISNATNPALNWFVNGVLNGNPAQGTLGACTTVAPLTCTYTAPPVNVPRPNPAVIEVASSADPEVQDRQRDGD